MSVLYGGPAHIKLIAEWEAEVKACVFGVVADYLPDPHQSVQELRQRYNQPLTADLHDCLNIYTKEETVRTLHYTFIIQMVKFLILFLLLSSSCYLWHFFPRLE